MMMRMVTAGGLAMMTAGWFGVITNTGDHRAHKRPTTLPIGAARVADTGNYAVIPRPTVLTPRTGAFHITAQTTIVADPMFTAVGSQFAREIAGATGFNLTVARSAATGARSIRLVRAVGADTGALGAEGYQLDIAATGITVRAARPAGAFYALETLKQLLPPAIYRDAPIANTQWYAPAVHIEDAPRFQWRGAHLDVARHFMPKEFVKKYIDLLARHKLNRFHWHLTEDQGWRIEIKKYPRLTEIGSCREQTMIPPYQTDPAKRVYDGKRHCGFYTQEDVREIVAYAAARHITVVPEIEMPGHAQAAIAAYPQLGINPDTVLGLREIWGVSAHILNADQSTVNFMQDVLREVLTLFPGQYIHVGGDEADKSLWKTSPKIQARIKELGLKDEHELQSWFIRQMDTFLTANNRRLVGWDEILEGGLAENATVMSWRGTAGGIDAAKAGHDVVMAPVSHTYFDYYQSRDRTKEPFAIGGFLPLDTVYAFEPVPAVLTAEQAKHILGAQAQLWTEYIPNPKAAEYMAYPRLSALAEVVWTQKSRRDYADFSNRLQTHVRRLDAMDVNYRKP